MHLTRVHCTVECGVITQVVKPPATASSQLDDHNQPGHCGTENRCSERHQDRLLQWEVGHATSSARRIHGWAWQANESSRRSGAAGTAAAAGLWGVDCCVVLHSFCVFWSVFLSQTISYHICRWMSLSYEGVHRLLAYMPSGLLHWCKVFQYTSGWSAI